MITNETRNTDELVYDRDLMDILVELGESDKWILDWTKNPKKVYVGRKEEQRQESIKQRAKDHRTPMGQWKNFCRSANRRHIPIHLTYEQFHAIRSSGPCHYCGWELPKTGGGLDRIVSKNKTPYRIGNCVPCCTICQMARNDKVPYECMKLIGPWIRAILNLAPKGLQNALGKLPEIKKLIHKIMEGFNADQLEQQHAA